MGRQERLKEGRFVQSSATCGGKRLWCLRSEEHIIPSHAWQNEVNPPGEQHLADFATLPHAVVQDICAERNQQRRISRALTVSSKIMRKTYWQWCHASILRTKTCNIRIKKHKWTRFGKQYATLYARRITKSVSRLVKDQSVTHVRTMTFRNQHNKELGNRSSAQIHRPVTVINDAS